MIGNRLGKQVSSRQVTDAAGLISCEKGPLCTPQICAYSVNCWICLHSHIKLELYL